MADATLVTPVTMNPLLLLWKWSCALVWAVVAAVAERMLLKLRNSPGETLCDGVTGRERGDPAAIIPRSVNYHFTRKCNYKCGFCFHTETSSFYLPLEEAKKGLSMLKDQGEFGNVHRVLQGALTKRA